MGTSEIIMKLDRIENLLLSQKAVLNFDETAEFTGLSKSTLYKKTMRAEIPHYKPNGKQIYFNRAELEKWLQRNRVKTQEEVEAEAETYVLTHKKERGVK